MWWKIAAAFALGIAVGAAAISGTIYSFQAAVRDTRAGYVSSRWSSAGKDWEEFANWLRHGGRKLVEDGAFTLARDGLTEAEVRAIFGPPDLVVVGSTELDAYRVVRMKGADGAYFYKIGRFAGPRNEPTNDIFAIVFDSKGRVVYRMGFAVTDNHELANIGAETRTERRIAP